ncbi:hypothetical protein Pyn_40018 [Prunus yedoensis var. nudiflora]|uniref:Uncharacterized protein n=1 Tax=Prunus yedoensis var. nudiflora TaxID=2094558 RepID=A0A314ZRY6_PRUYE|nr:hypothetical protein Pyn_40018 [Prunus yedoensis var. nudiflora]
MTCLKRRYTVLNVVLRGKPSDSYSRNLNDRQVIELLRATCQRPQEREFNVMQMLRKNNSTRGGFMDEALQSSLNLSMY